MCVCWVVFQELVVMGAPGSYYWTGTIKVYNLTSDSFYSPNKENVDSHRYSYLGKELDYTPTPLLFLEGDYLSIT